MIFANAAVSAAQKSRQSDHLTTKNNSKNYKYLFHFYLSILIRNHTSFIFSGQVVGAGQSSQFQHTVTFTRILKRGKHGTFAQILALLWVIVFPLPDWRRGREV